jgi:hypothetical protein
VLYLTQAIGLALGLPEKKLALHRHMVKVVFPFREKALPEKIKKVEEAAEQAEE